MPTFIDTILQELSEIGEEDLIDPRDEIEEGACVIGELDLNLRKLYTLTYRYAKAAAEAKTEAMGIALILKTLGGELKEEAQEKIRKAAELVDKTSILREILWASINDSFDLWGEESTSIREGWKIVQCKEESEDCETCKLTFCVIHPSRRQ